MCKEAGIAKPIIFCVTAYESISFKNIAISSGMDDFFSKPLKHEQVQMIKAILDGEKSE